MIPTDKRAITEGLKSAFGMVVCPMLMAVGCMGGYKSLAMIAGLAMGSKTPIDPQETVIYSLVATTSLVIGGAGYLRELSKENGNGNKPDTKPPSPNGPS